MALVIIYAVLLHFDFVAKFTVKNLNKDFTNTGKFFIKPYYFLKYGFPYNQPDLLFSHIFKTTNSCYKRQKSGLSGRHFYRNQILTKIIDQDIDQDQF